MVKPFEHDCPRTLSRREKIALAKFGKTSYAPFPQTWNCSPLDLLAQDFEREPILLGLGEFRLGARKGLRDFVKF